MNLRLLQIAAGDEQVRQIHVRGIVVGIQFSGARKFLIGAIPVVQFEIGFPELVVGLGKAGIYLDGIGILDGGLAILAFCEVALGAFKVFLLAYVGVARASREQGSKHAADQEKAEGRGTHDVFSSCRSRKAQTGHQPRIAS